jgi:hypothetical protein
MQADGSFSLAHAHTLSHHIGGGSWSGVARRLGARPVRSRRPPRFSYEEARAALLACHEQLGRGPCQREYSA